MIQQRRLGIDEYLMSVAHVVSARSDWPGTRVGCVAAVDGMVRSTGYNGTPKGFNLDKWEDVTTPENQLANSISLAKMDKAAMKPFYCHAEENVIVQAARAGVCLHGTSFYCTLSCCLTCARMIINVGVRAFYFETWWDKTEDAQQAVRLLEMSNVRVAIVAARGGK